MPDDLEGQASERKFEVDYDEPEMSDSVPPEEFEFSPKWAQEKFSKLAYQRKQERARADRAEGKAAALEAQSQQLAQRLAALENRVTGTEAEKPKEGIEGISETNLREYKSRAYGWMQRAQANPDDADARAEVSKVDWGKLSLVDEELARRAALKPVQELEQKMTQREQAQMQNAVLTNKLRMKYGDEVMDLNSPLMKRAAEIARDLVGEFGLPSLDAGSSVLAVERAHNELRKNRSGRELSEADRRRLSLEAGARREAQAINTSAALRSKGDWKSKVAAVDIELDAFFDGMGIPKD